MKLKIIVLNKHLYLSPVFKLCLNTLFKFTEHQCSAEHRLRTTGMHNLLLLYIMAAIKFFNFFFFYINYVIIIILLFLCNTMFSRLVNGSKFEC